MNIRLLLLTLSVTALIISSQYVKACDPYEYGSGCYGDYTYETYDRPSDHHSDDRPRDTYEILSDNQDRHQALMNQSDRQLQNLYEEGRHQAVMRELQQINESLNR